ncbi:EamA family transporter [Levilactobacillus namurensis]|nr:EamA family transporter [Levilactobacillus namurensis]MCW3778821.1 EamA family transporter [Levilactobacillus namurensis]MDT7019395.1 EamA family transporter [Levilactobacillus namurensis]WNN66713.1 EamA family transporter [Levilactobacillus namurensis]
MFYLGAVSTALAFFLWDQGLRHFNSPASGIFFLIQPVVGSLLGWWCLQEPLSGGFFVGLGLILLSVLVTYRFG